MVDTTRSESNVDCEIWKSQVDGGKGIRKLGINAQKIQNLIQDLKADRSSPDYLHITHSSGTRAVDIQKKAFCIFSYPNCHHELCSIAYSNNLDDILQSYVTKAVPDILHYILWWYLWIIFAYKRLKAQLQLVCSSLLPDLRLVHSSGTLASHYSDQRSWDCQMVQGRFLVSFCILHSSIETPVFWEPVPDIYLV